MRYRIMGDAGAVVTFEVPGPGVDQRTFDARVASGEWTILDDVPAADTSVSGRPAVNDPKSVWVDYAETAGVDTDGLTKQEVIDAVDGLS